MEKISKGKYEFIGVAIGFFVIFALTFAFMIFPIIRGIVYNSDEIQKKIIDNEINKAGIEKIPEMKNVHEIFMQKQDTLNVIITEGGEVDFMKKMEALADETGNKIELKIQDKDPNAKKDDKTKDLSIVGNLPYNNYMLMDITLLGNYDGLIKFLSKLEKFEKYANVVKVDLSKVEEDQEAVNKNIFYSAPTTTPLPEVKKKELLKSILSLAVYVKQ